MNQETTSAEKFPVASEQVDVTFNLLSHIDVHVTRLTTLFHLLDSVNALLQTELSDEQVNEVIGRKDEIESKIAEQISHAREYGFYREISNFLNDVHKDFCPPELYPRKEKFSSGTLRLKIKSAFLGLIGKQDKKSVENSFDAESTLKSLRLDQIPNLELEKMKELLLLIAEKPALVSDEISEALKQVYIKKRSEKIKTVQRERHTFSFDQVKRTYEKLGLLDNLKGKELSSADAAYLKIFSKEYINIFSRLQLIYDMAWKDFGSKFARGSLMYPREFIGNLQILFGQFKDKHDLIDSFWSKEVGRHNLVWELTVTGQIDGLVVHKKITGEQFSGANVEFTMRADWQGENSGLVKTKLKKGKRFFEAWVTVDGVDKGFCEIEVTDAFKGQSEGNFIKLDGKMDVISVSQKASDRDLATRAYGSYPSEFHVTPNHEKKLEDVDERYLYSCLLQRKLVAMRQDRKVRPHVLSPLQRKEQYSVIFYFGDKRKKIFVSEESLYQPPEKFYQTLVANGLDFDENFSSFSRFDTSAKTRRKKLKSAYKSRDYIQDVQDKIADPTDLDACDLCFVISDEQDLTHDFQDVLSDVRLSNNGVKKLDSICIKKASSEDGKIKSVITLTNHSSADGVKHVQETKDVFRDALNQASEMTDSARNDETYFAKKYSSVGKILNDGAGVAIEDFSESVRQEVITEFSFPISEIRDMLDAPVGDTGKSLYQFWKDRYGIKLSLTNLLPFSDMILAESERWTFLTKKENDRLVPAVAFFPQYLKDQLKIANITGRVEKIDLENLAMQFFQFEVDKENIQRDEGTVATMGVVATNGVRILARHIGAISDNRITDVVQNTGMQSTMVLPRGFEYDIVEGKRVYKLRDENQVLQQVKFATGVDSFCRYGVTAATEYLKVNDETGELEPHIFVSFRQNKDQKKQYEIDKKHYENNLLSLINFFRIAAENEVAGWKD
ncbi:MAG: hypothetical protein BroJett025_02870 [Patescibacteria group bacterium]|nr:MAG: hypothetical protein BroJett025_02870 [Patescibacteria group bacterium]